jgi:hypothetical protein
MRVWRKVIAPGEVEEGGGARMRDGRREGRERTWMAEEARPTNSEGE